MFAHADNDLLSSIDPPKLLTGLIVAVPCRYAITDESLEREIQVLSMVTPESPPPPPPPQ